MLKRILIIVMLAVTALGAEPYVELSGVMNWANITNITQMADVANQIVMVHSYSTSDTNTMNEVGDNAGATDEGTPSKWTHKSLQNLVLTRYDDLWHGEEVLDGNTNYYLQGDYYNQDRGVYAYNYPIEEFYVAAGIHSNGFRRAQTNWPSDWRDLDDADFTYGTVQAGDIIGPWVVDDIQKCFSTMTQLVDTVTWSWDSATVTNRYEGSGAYASSSWATEVAECAVDYDASSLSQGGLPTAYYLGRSEVGATTNYRTYAQTFISTQKATIYGSNIAREVSYYSRGGHDFGSGSTNVFHANGSIVVDGAWFVVSSTNETPATQSVTVYSDTLGNNTIPEVTDKPDDTTSENRFKGWRIEASDSAVMIQNFEWKYMR